MTAAALRDFLLTQRAADTGAWNPVAMGSASAASNGRTKPSVAKSSRSASPAVADAHIISADRKVTTDVHTYTLCEGVKATEIALAEHGLVADRARQYFSAQLPPFRQLIKEADCILVAAHSQGCVVAGGCVLDII